ncbi:MAG: nitroreductase family deazaflavin-dependent oxidoreductase [Leptolinea sp.]|nr:nitroreductase family deazaflavin-dependent oxidoreductase [Leptolinea sp.]
MAKKIKDVEPPTGISRILWRIPIFLYRIGLGWLLGHRFLLLNHRGRKSGLYRKAVIEVVKFDHEAGFYYVVSGFGPRSDWYQNVIAHPDVTIQVGSKKMKARGEKVPLTVTEEILLDYSIRHPGALKTLSRILGYAIDECEADVRFMASIVPMIRFEQKEY